MGREVKRVSLDFDWPINERWVGYLNPYWKYRKECPLCHGSGYSTTASRFKDQWYGIAYFNPEEYGAKRIPADHPAVMAAAERNTPSSCTVGPPGTRDRVLRREAEWLCFKQFHAQWRYNLIQADVDALLAEGRLNKFTHTIKTGEGWVPIEPPPVVTPEMVNQWSIENPSHDAINSHICIRARCEREGHSINCERCGGSGEVWPSKYQKKLHDDWLRKEPPKGDGWQMWETTTAGSPMSPVFATPEELARWLADNKASAFGRSTATYEQWLGMIWSGHAPSMVADGQGIRSGVEFVASNNTEAGK